MLPASEVSLRSHFIELAAPCNNTVTALESVVGRGTMDAMTAKEKLLAEAPRWSEAQATTALQAAERESELAAYLDAEAQLSPTERDARENGWAAANGC